MDHDAYLNTKNYAQSSALALLDRVINRTKESFVNQAWKPLVLIARARIISLLKKIAHGQLTVFTPESLWTFGNPTATYQENGATQKPLKVTIRVVKEAFWVRMFLLSDLGFAEAYMVGDIEVDDLGSLFKMFIMNRTNLSELSMATSSIYASFNSLMNSRFVNSISNSISNISAHYDISNDMFKSFLSDDMTYSCAYFTPEMGGLNGDIATHPGKKVLNDGNPKFAPGSNASDDLEEAQYAKLDLIIQKTKIANGHRVLEIGTGWGSFAIRAVQKTGCQVDTITLSIEQKELAEQRIRQAGLHDSIRVHLMDYRDLPCNFMETFDCLVSIEMIEGVGLEYLEDYFRIVDKFLKDDTGIGVFQVITIPESRFDRYRNEVDFIRKWIFPGGVLPSVTFMTNSIAKGSKNRLIIDSIENIGPHYARTLREWNRRFEKNFDIIIQPSLVRRYFPPSKNSHDTLHQAKAIEIFRKKWNYYFSYSAAGFSCRVLNDHIFTITREGNRFMD